MKHARPAATAPVATATGVAPAGWRVTERWLEATFLVGLASVFLTNAVTAFLQPDDFTKLVDQSAIGRWLPVPTGSWVGIVICANDLVLGLALLPSVWFRRARLPLLAWAGLWLFVVTAVRVTSLDAFQ